MSVALLLVCASVASATGKAAIAAVGVIAISAEDTVAVAAAGVFVGDEAVGERSGVALPADNSGVAVTVVSTRVGAGVGDITSGGSGVMVEPAWLEAGVRVGGRDVGDAAGRAVDVAAVVNVADVIVGVAPGRSVGVAERLGVGEGTV